MTDGKKAPQDMEEQRFGDYIEFDREGYRTIQSYIWALEFYFGKRDIEHIHDIIDKVASHILKDPRDMKLFWRFYGVFLSLLKQEAETNEVFGTLPGSETIRSREEFSLFISILHTVTDEVMGTRSPHPRIHGNAKSMILDIQQYIQTHFQEDINLTVLSRRFAISEKYLSSLFKTVAKQNLVSFVNDVRIENAKHMLMETTLSVQCIAGLCGFNDYFYFSKVFKKKTGVTATQYRTIQQKGSRQNEG